MPTPRRATAGFSLIELLIAMTMLVGVMGATYAMFKSQSVSFRQNTRRFDLVQNTRSSIELGERVIRTMGAGVTGQQPMLVYGANSVLAFNTDYIERDTVDMRWAAYWNPDVPLTESVTWDAASATPIPNSSPSYTYPGETYRMGNGALSPAETYMLYFSLDSDTPRSDDYALWQRVNAGTPEVLARNILPAADGSPFFRYLLHRVLPTGDTLLTASGGLLPLIRRQLVAGISSSDSAAYVRPDSVRAVQMNYQVTNGLVGAEERVRSVTTTIETPNNGVALPTVCGRLPLPPAGFAAIDPGDGSGTIQLTWNRSPDQDSGEQDVLQYIIWRRLSTTPLFSEPLLVTVAEQTVTSYTTDVLGHTPGTTYVFAIAAQDCTPSLSSVQTITVTPIAAP
jgi:prepilin-type N-terminal cleavage/methylation domain-containing protein